MTGREIGLCVVAALTVASAAGVAAAAFMARKWPEFPGAAALVLGPSLAFGLWAAIGWAWYGSGGIVR